MAWRDGEIDLIALDYSWYTGIADTAPQLPTATWRFDPKTGAVYMIDEELHQPDGIGFSPDGKILYLGDSGNSSKFGSLKGSSN